MTDDEIFALLLGHEARATESLAIIARDAVLVAKDVDALALAKAVANDVIRLRGAVRAEASKLLGLPSSGEQSSASDAFRGEKAGAYVAARWTSEVHGVDDERAIAATADVAAYEVFDAWNDEIERAIAATNTKAGTRGRWVAKHDKRTCPECEKLSGALSDNDGNFALPGGKRGRPPLHASCRCFVSTKHKASEESEKMNIQIQSREIIGVDGDGGALVQKAIRTAMREVDFVASSAREDSYGDVIDQESWQLSDYLANPIVLYGHQSRDLPIGTASNVGVRNGQLECTIRFASAEANPEAEKVWKLIQENVLRTVSVGFLPVDGRYETIAGREVFVWRSSILKEISVVPVPANPDALAKMKSAFRAKQAGTLEYGETAVYGKSGERTLLRAGGSVEINTITPAASPAANTNKGGDATKEKRNMELSKALEIIEAKSAEIGTLAANVKTAETALATEKAAKATVDAQLADVNTKLASITTEKTALDAQNAKLVEERDAMKAKLATVEAKAIEVEVEALVGKKIKPEEKALFIDLKKSSPDLFEKMVAQRDDLGLALDKSTTEKGEKANGGKTVSASANAVEKVFGLKS